MISIFFFYFLVVNLSFQQWAFTTAFSSRPGACSVGEFSVGHGVDSSGDIQLGGYELLLDGKVLNPHETFYLNLTSPSYEHSWELKSIAASDEGEEEEKEKEKEKEFRGFLLVAGGGSSYDMEGSFSVEDEGTSQIIHMCPQFHDGVGHRSNVPKSSVKGIIDIDQGDGKFTLDVSVVDKNSYGVGNSWFFSSYTVQVIGNNNNEEKEREIYPYHIEIRPNLNLKYNTFFTSTDNRPVLSAKLIYDRIGWVSIGIPLNQNEALMTGAHAIIGMPDEDLSQSNPGIYNLENRRIVELLPDEDQTLMQHSVIQTEETTIDDSKEQTILTFSKYLDESEDHVLDFEQPITLLYAVGLYNTFGVHAWRGGFEIDFVANVGDVVMIEEPTTSLSSGSGGVVSSPQDLWRIHGILMFAAWGIATPIAILASRLRMLDTSGKGIWFQIHFYLNNITVILSVASLVFAVRVTQQVGMKHFSTPHHIGGLLVIIFMMVQAIGGYLRPHVDVDAPSPSSKRKNWSLFHKGLGFITFIISIYQIITGFRKYSSYTGARDWTLAYGILLGVMFCVSGILLVLSRRTKINRES